MEDRNCKTACQRATKLFKSGFTKPALDITDLSLADNSDQGELWLLRATILHSEGKWAEALVAIETAAALIPLTLGGELVLADCYSQIGKHELALSSYEYLFSRQTLPVSFYAGLYAGFKRANRFDLAMSACRRAIELAPENDEAYFGMAHCMSALAYPPRQITAVLQKAVNLAPDKTHYRLSLALQLSLTKRRVQAYDVLAKRKPEILKTLTCSCMARQLLELCVWAGDHERCSLLGGVLAKLSNQSEEVTADQEIGND